jgi:hypothetical protein
LTLTGATTGAGISAIYNASLDSYYALVSTAMTWEAAMDNAQASFLGGVAGTLVNVNSADEQAYVASLSVNSLWIGASDKLQEGVWRWYDGDTPGSQFWNGTSGWGATVGNQYSFWNSGEPNASSATEDYAHVHSAANVASRAWNDALGTPVIHSVVEWTGTAFRAAQGVASSVMENAAEGTVVGTLGATDADAGETLTYEIVGANSNFEVVGNELRVKAGATLDHESASQHTLTIRVTDSANHTFDQVITVNVVNVNEAPSNTGTISGANLITNGSFESGFTPNHSWGYQGSTVTGWTLDAGNAFNVTSSHFGMTPSHGTYWLDMHNTSDNITVSQVVAGITNGQGYQLTVDARAFNFNSNNYGDGINVIWGGQVVGTIMEVNGWNTFRYNVVGGSGDGSNRLTLQGFGFADNEGLAIDNVTLTQIQTNSPTLSITENSANGVIVGQVASTDPDAYGTLFYSLTDSAGGRFAINSSTGQMSRSPTPRPPSKPAASTTAPQARTQPATS